MELSAIKKPILRCVANTLNRILWVDLPFMNWMENRMIRIITLTIMLFIAATITSTAQTIVNEASELAWDYGDVTNADHFNLYIRPAAGIVPDGNPEFTIPYGTYDDGTWEHFITVPAGHYFAVVTAVSIGPNPVESGPSNEVEFIVFSAPTGLRIQ